jgi:hypothetical protein
VNNDDESNADIRAGFEDANQLPANDAIRKTLESTRKIEMWSRVLVVETLTLLALSIVLAFLTWRLALR